MTAGSLSDLTKTSAKPLSTSWRLLQLTVSIVQAATRNGNRRKRGFSPFSTMMMHSAASHATLTTPTPEHSVPLAMCSFLSAAVGADGPQAFHKRTLLNDFGHRQTTARAASFLHRPDACSTIQRQQRHEFLAFSVRQLAVRPELYSQVPRTLFPHERDASEAVVTR